MKACMIILLLSPLFLALFDRRASAETDRHKGLHVICWNTHREKTGPQALKAILDLDYVSGLMVYTDWSDLEPSEGEYQWRLIDFPLEQAEARGKTVSFGLLVCSRSPKWLLERSEKFNYRHIHPAVGSVTAPIPWDDIYRNSLYATISEIGKRYDGRPGLEYVCINGPSTLFGVETNFPIASISDEEAAKVDFSLEKYERFWRESIDRFVASFPRTRLALGLHDQISFQSRVPERDVETARSLRDYFIRRQEEANGNRTVLRLLGLASDNPRYFPGPYEGDPDIINDYVSLVWEVQDEVDIAFEVARIFSRNNANGRSALDADGFRRVLQNGFSYGPNWIEVKSPDIWVGSEGRPYEPYVDPLKDLNDLFYPTF